MPLWLKCRLSGGMNFVRAKRILTGLPDDRKNFFLFAGAARQKNISSGCAFQIPDQWRPLSSEESLRELCAFAPSREAKPREAIFSRRRKGAKFARILLEFQLGLRNHEISTANEREYSRMSISYFSVSLITGSGLPAPSCFIISPLYRPKSPDNNHRATAHYPKGVPL